jgi:hypothetical protein
LSGDIVDKKGDDDRSQYQTDRGLPKRLEQTPATDIRETEEAMAGLEAAAAAGDEAAFLAAVKSVEWAERTTAEFLCATRLALKAGAHLAARQISALGLERYPTNPEVQKFAHALAPPRVIGGSLPRDPDIEANQRWLRAHAGEYTGKWVAIKNGQLLGAADSLKHLVDQLGNINGVLITAAR